MLNQDDLSDGMSDTSVAIHGLIRSVLSRCRSEIEGTGLADASIEWHRKLTGLGIGLTLWSTRSNSLTQRYGIIFKPNGNQVAVEMFKGKRVQPFDVFSPDDLNEEVIRSLVMQTIVEANS